MKATPIIAVVLSLALSTFTAVAAVVVTNVTAVGLPENIVTINYDLTSPSALTNTVTISISTNSGVMYFNTCTNFTGAVGNNVATGTAKQILWNAIDDALPTGNYPHTRVRVWASDSMALIPAGAFLMGSNSFADGLGNDAPGSSPRHEVTISAFYMDMHEVSYTLWNSVYQWAVVNGYHFDNGGNSKDWSGTQPVQIISWYDSVKWCNARSQKEGLTPCYYSNAAQTIVYKNGKYVESNAWNDVVNWSANGYRLPTEAEWEKAARGGAIAMRFPWSDAYTITNSRANYYGEPISVSYDLGPEGHNPLFASGNYPYTNPVGYFAPNSYGLYNMAGNVREWCWDWYGESYYSISPGTDPRGPSSGMGRIMRGGAWNSYAYSCRVANRNYAPPEDSWNDIGFRCARGL